MDRVDPITRRHLAEFGRWPELVVAAPGRVNLIGEHTDYHEGHVLPMAIERVVRAAASRRPDRVLGLCSVDYGSRLEVPLDRLARDPAHPWADYPRGVVRVMSQAGHALGGLELTLEGDVPQGSGLSSSAALEVASALAVQELFGLVIAPEELARLAQRAEVEFIGVRCGIMDQLISRLGQAGAALLIDCRSLTHRRVPLALGGFCFLITNSNAPRTLAGSAYNQRRDECQRGLRALQRLRPGGAALRDYGPAEVRAAAGDMGRLAARRCLHVTEENQRTLEAAEALGQGDLAAFGRLMNASHDSLRDQYEVSSPELDFLVEQARQTEGVLGARLTGAGFGGCTVTLLEAGAVPAYEARVLPAYERRFGRRAEVLASRPGPGARVLRRFSDL
ncbi:MAG TPA: galactokinase [Myxococcota bacterium]|nr:galactokinase [Myxococcota bacterium]HRY92787.1 galactokinase [Myxococcota bacterium]HSA19837.1 galactokinase [Myxococcota bacterium]